MISILILIVGIALLVWASDLFVDAAEDTGKALKMPSFIIGVVIVGIGTSLPELVSSLVAVFQGASEIVPGNVLGSNTTNILLVLGVGALMSKNMKFEKDLLHGDMPILLSASLFLYFTLADGNFSLAEAIIFLVAVTFYIIHTLKSGSDDKDTEEHKITALTIGKLLISPVLIYFGAKFTVDAVIDLSEYFKIGKEVIALSAVALGTSLPEVMVSIAAARKGKSDMIVGNVVGSNIFNTFVVMGIPRLFGEISIKGVADFSLPFSVAATVLFVIITVDKKIPKWEGAFLLLFYVYFILKLFGADHGLV